MVTAKYIIAFNRDHDFYQRPAALAEADNLEALASGMNKLCRQARGAADAPAPDWDGYVAYASWDSNAAIISDAATSSLARR